MALERELNKMPKLQKFRDYHYEATAKVSENTRTLAISAIAIVWLFKEQNGKIFSVPSELQFPLFLVVIALALDFIQYVLRSVIWHFIFRSEEKRLSSNKKMEEIELHVSPWVNTFPYFFFYLKVISILLAYYFLISYFIRSVKWV